MLRALLPALCLALAGVARGAGLVSVEHEGGLDSYLDSKPSTQPVTAVDVSAAAAGATQARQTPEPQSLGSGRLADPELGERGSATTPPAPKAGAGVIVCDYMTDCPHSVGGGHMKLPLREGVAYAARFTVLAADGARGGWQWVFTTETPKIRQYKGEIVFTASVSKEPGDFSAGPCRAGSGLGGSVIRMFALKDPRKAKKTDCVVEPGGTYYFNLRNDACPPDSPYGCPMYADPYGGVTDML